MGIGSEIISEIIDKIGPAQSAPPVTKVSQKRVGLRKGSQSYALARLRKKTIEKKKQQRADLALANSRAKKTSPSEKTSKKKGSQKTTTPVNKSVNSKEPNLGKLVTDLVELGKRLRNCYEDTAPKRQLIPLTAAQSVVLERRTKRTERKNRSKRRIRCQICGLFVNDRKSLDAHLKNRHHVNSSGSVPYCNLCGLTFNGPIQEQAHLIGKRHQAKVRKAEFDRRSRARNK